MVHSFDTKLVQLQICTQQRYGPNPVCCANKESQVLLELLRQEVANNRLDIDLVTTPCLLRCDDGPNIRLLPGNKIWSFVSIDTIPDIVLTCKEICKND